MPAPQREVFRVIKTIPIGVFVLVLLRNLVGLRGAGIDLANDRTLTAVWRYSIVTQHPDTLTTVSGVQIPYFDRMLEIAVGCNKMTGFSYVGVDLVLDRKQGPLMLEINARPELNIEIANRAGLAARLEEVDRTDARRLPPAGRIKFAKEHFRVNEYL